MVAECKKRNVEALLGDFRSFRSAFADAALIWSNCGLIHLPIDEFSDGLRFLAACVKPNGIVAISFKTGDDIFRVDPADDRVPVDRPTSFHRIESVRQTLSDAGCEVVASIHVPSEADTTFDYCWLFALKKS